MKSFAIAAATAALVLAPTALLAQSAGTSLTGTSNGKQGTPPSATTSAGASAGSSASVGATQTVKPGDTPGNSGALGKTTAEQHEKLGN